MSLNLFRRGHTHSSAAWLWTAITISLLSLSSCDLLTSKAEGEASDIGCNGDFGYFNNQFDAGVNVRVTVTNVGESGPINITPKVSTSEYVGRRMEPQPEIDLWCG